MKRFLNKIGFVPVLLLIGQHAWGALTFLSGIADAGADIGHAPTQSTPPSSPDTIDVFYDFRNLTSTPYDPSGLQAGGWATTSWQLSGGNTGAVIANGSSGQGFNGAVDNNGWIYAWGHSSFLVTFSIDEPYAFSYVNTPSGVQLTSVQTGNVIAGNSGVLFPGGYEMIAKTYGTGGFSVDAVFTPIPEPRVTTTVGALGCLGALGGALLRHTTRVLK